MNSFGFSLTTSELLAALALLVGLSAFCVGEEDLYVVQLPENVDGSPIRMRYIPKGRLPSQDLGSAEVGSSDDHGNKPVEVEAFYMSETELTFAQAKEFLPEENWNAVRNAVRQIKQPAELAQAIDSLDKPAFLLDLRDISLLCKSLDEHVNRESKKNGKSIEIKWFRVPAYYEWQYACRGLVDVPKVDTIPFFYNWQQFDELPVIEQGRIKDAYENIYAREFKPDNGWGLSQQDAMALSDSLSAEGNTNEAVSILNAYLKSSLQLERDFTSPTRELYPAISSQPNRWGLHRMHGNLSEWSILGDDVEQVNACWNEISEADENTLNECVILVGGGFTEALEGEGAWRAFSMRGGVPYKQPNPFELAPYSIAQAIDRKNVSTDRYPGVRLVMERTIDDEWFIIVRTSLLLDRADESTRKELISRFRQTVNEVAYGSRVEHMSKVLNIYEKLGTTLSEEEIANIYMDASNITGLFEEQADSDVEAGLAAIAALNLSGIGDADSGREKQEPASVKSQQTDDPESLYFRLSAEVARISN